MKLESNQSDFKLEQNVINELKWEPSLGGQSIDVAVKDGIVTLSGLVDSYAKKLTAERVVKRVENVMAVVERIKVELSNEHIKTDEEIAEAAVSALKWHTDIPDGKIKLVVEDSVITMEGEVEWRFQRESADYAVSYLEGVKAVNNFIKITPRVKITEVKSKIEDAFRRSAILDASGIQVEVEGSRIILKGKVSSWTEWEDADKVAWAAPGVTNVENNIIVHAPSYTTER